jgi:hypothetical protein
VATCRSLLDCRIIKRTHTLKYAHAIDSFVVLMTACMADGSGECKLSDSLLRSASPRTKLVMNKMRAYSNSKLCERCGLVAVAVRRRRNIDTCESGFEFNFAPGVDCACAGRYSRRGDAGLPATDRVCNMVYMHPPTHARMRTGAHASLCAHCKGQGGSPPRPAGSPRNCLTVGSTVIVFLVRARARASASASASTVSLMPA